MKNRKLFAIITLVAFMLTMMPVMAFGAATGGQIELTKSYADVEAGDKKVDANQADLLKGTVYLNSALSSTQKLLIVAKNAQTGVLSADATIVVGSAPAAATDLTSIIAAAGKEGYAFSATAAGPSIDFYAFSDGVESLTFEAYVVDGKVTADDTKDIRIPVINAIGKLSSDTCVMFKVGTGVNATIGSVNTDVTMDATFTDYKAGSVAATNLTGAVAVDINGVTSDANLNGTDTTDGSFAVTTALTKPTANNGLGKYKVVVTLKKGGVGLANAPLSVNFSKSGIAINKDSVTTNAGGIATFDVYATKGDDYVMTVNSGDFSQDFKLSFDSINAAKGKFTNVTTDTIATGDSVKVASIVCTDSLGNEVNFGGDLVIEVVKAPEASALEGATNTTNAAAINVVTANKILKFKADVAGEYTLKIYNKNTGVSDTMTVKAAKFGTVDHITIAYASSSYALGEKTKAPSISKYDKDGVVSTINNNDGNLKVSYAGVGVETFSIAGATKGQIQFAKAAAYAGQKIVVTAVYKDAYIATTELTVGVQPANIVFTDATGAAGAETTVKGQLVDLNGDKVAFSSEAVLDTTCVVVAKPEGALVSVDASKIGATTIAAGVDTNAYKNTGVATLGVSSNKEGIVKVNVITKVTIVGASTYFVAGTATVNFGGVAVVETPAESIVNMIIGANTVIADNKASASPVAPFIENGRTFVPVRAFAEATGATVNYDAATQVITIKATGVDAQMTVGSNVMTVNGETVVMDAAAQVIGEGYTVLPVRYAGQALGYSFDVAYGANGAVTAVTMTK